MNTPYPRPEITPMQIRSVSIVVPNPRETASFFADTLDLPVTHHPGSAEVRIGASTLSIEQGDPEPDGYYHLAFDIPENTIADAHTLLRERVDILPAGEDDIMTGSPFWDSHSVYFNAPGNLNLELIARHRLPNAISTPFAFTDIQHISEVGIPVDDPLDAVARLDRAFGLASFGEPSEMFAPVGSDAGLLIIVRSGRNWFPTDEQLTTSRPLAIDLAGVSGTLALGDHCTLTGDDSHVQDD